MIYEAYKDKSTVSCVMDDWLGNRLDKHTFNEKKFYTFVESLRNDKFLSK